MSDHPSTSGGARFFDGESRDLGWAKNVTKRASRVSTLTVFDVIGAGPELAQSLARLDRGRLQIQYTDLDGERYRFRWASGYGNGDDVRIQGVLEPK
jgi:hypothetical protein